MEEFKAVLLVAVAVAIIVVADYFGFFDWISGGQ